MLNENLSIEDLRKIISNAHLLGNKEHSRSVLEAANELLNRKLSSLKRSSLLDFVKHMDPDYKIGSHHKRLAKILEDMAYGRKDRATVSMAPRMGKSQLTSIYFPAWFIGNFPHKKILMVSHTSDLAVDFGRKVRNLVGDDRYKEIFPGVDLAADSKSAGRWNTNKGGEYYACGVGSALAGRGGDLIVLDDPHNEQDILNGNYEIFEKAYQWYAYGLRTRLMPGGAVAIVATRWAPNDLIGKVVEDSAKNPGADQWDVVEFPAILNEGTDEEKSLWPEQWSLESLLRTKASMPAFQWNAQYMQKPTAEEGAIIKREWWQPWPYEEPPACSFIIMALDAAAEKNNRADFTALLTWGVFYSDDEDTGEKTAKIILLNAIKKRMEFPELKELAYEEYTYWQPDAFIVEKKSAGTQLYQEMRRAGVPVQEFTPTRASGDKVARLMAVSDIFASGMVYYPAGRRWAEEVIEEVSSFPVGPHDDQVDCTSMALARFRNGGFISLLSDRDFDDGGFVPRRAAYY